MLDVHPPEHTPHSCRDFFIHIATIVVGLIIAVALEQTVEFFHHRHQRVELEEALHADTVKAIKDTNDEEMMDAAYLQWLNTRIDQVQDALESDHPLGTRLNPGHFDQSVDDPAWKAAKASGLVALLPENEINTYSVIDSIMDHVAQSTLPWDVALKRRNELEWKFERHGAATPDFSHASRQDLQEYLNALLDVKSNSEEVFATSEDLREAEVDALRAEKSQ